MFYDFRAPGLLGCPKQGVFVQVLVLPLMFWPGVAPWRPIHAEEHPIVKFGSNLGLVEPFRAVYKKTVAFSLIFEFLDEASFSSTKTRFSSTKRGFPSTKIWCSSTKRAFPRRNLGFFSTKILGSFEKHKLL